MNKRIEVNPKGYKDLESIRLTLKMNVREFCSTIGLHHSAYYDGLKSGRNLLSPLQWAIITHLWLRAGNAIDDLIGELLIEAATKTETQQEYPTGKAA